ncbi:hypothetical protein D3C75_1260900 [compost metagenome]
MGYLFQEAAGAGGAFVVHDEFGYFSVAGIDPDGLGVLAADIDDGFDLGIEKMRAQRVAGNLGDNFMGGGFKLEGNPSVACSDNAADIV